MQIDPNIFLHDIIMSQDTAISDQKTSSVMFAYLKTRDKAGN